MALNFTNLSKPKPFARKILLYGGSNAGKTFLAGSALEVPEMREVLVVNLDAGAKTLEGMDISVQDSRKLSELEEVLWAFAQKKPEVAKFTTLVIDGMSEVAKRELSEITTLEAQSDKGKARNRDRDQAELRDYGIRNARLLRIVRMARDLPDITVIITAWDKKTYPKLPGSDQDNKAAAPLSVQPDFSDSIVTTIVGAMDDCWYLKNDEENGRRIMYTSDYGATKAKTRTASFAQKLGLIDKDGKFAPVVINPSFAGIVAAYKEATKTKEGK